LVGRSGWPIIHDLWSRVPVAAIVINSNGGCAISLFNSFGALTPLSSACGLSYIRAAVQDGPTVYIATNTDLRVIDLTQAASLTAPIIDATNYDELTVSDDLLIAGHGVERRLDVYDIAAPLAPQLISSMNSKTRFWQYARSLAVLGSSVLLLHYTGTLEEFSLCPAP
jgi:hypothetical protein